MLQADYLVDIGPLAGEHGGNIVAKGTPKEVMENENSLTGKYLSGKLKIDVPKTRRKGNKKYLEVIGAKENNLKNINVKFPLGTLTCVTGVSGSGKSSLVNEILYKAVAANIYKTKDKPGKHKEIKGINYIDKVIDISQAPIGRTPRSNPATYVGVFDDIRDVFTQTKEAKMRGYDKGRFSFNVKGGRCEACQGDGVKKIEMHFLPDVYVPCEVCKGTRYNSETLQIKYKGKNIYDVLEMRVEEALEFFENVPKVKSKLETLCDVGLSYIKLGQSAPTLSGGEAARVKLAKELQKKPTGKSLFILDEPSTGLHIDDIKKLLVILERIVDNGAVGIRCHGVLQTHWDACIFCGLHASGMQNLCSEVGKLCCFLKVELVYSICILHKAWVVVVHSVNISPYLNLLCTESDTDERRREVASATL